MSVTGNVERRQIWALPTTTTTSYRRHCTPFHLPAKGVISIDSTSVITLTQNAIFLPECSDTPNSNETGGIFAGAIIDLRDPFYASTSPQIYAIATATVISWMLVIMLFITPRTFFIGGVGGGGAFLGRRGMISGVSGNIIGVGGRPLLQKVATLTVAISLTIATFNTFRVAQEQYDLGYQDAVALTLEVVGGLELRVIRVISTTFLWLAQVQTLIRLFPRHREKVIIKWTGFALIVFDTVFSILNSFVDSSVKTTRPRSFTDAIPALSYLFELALSLLYAAWVIYYSLHKRRFAFFHPLMRNIYLVAIISLIAVLIPVVFFVLDIAKPSLAGWGDYMRWVGAAAASVVVWEWVERIEALEREERKDGILGREVFDGDEMLEATPSTEGGWPGPRRGHPSGRGGRDRLATTTGRYGASTVAHRSKHSQAPPHYTSLGGRGPRGVPRRTQEASMGGGVLGPELSRHNGPTLPPPIATPVSRTDTTSAASTIYAVRYHPISESTSPGPEQPQMGNMLPHANNVFPPAVPHNNTRQAEPNKEGADLTVAPLLGPSNLVTVDSRLERHRWQNVSNPFKRRRTSPPPQVSQAAADLPAPQTRPQSATPAHRSSTFSRFRIGRHLKPAGAPLPVMVIPVPPRGRVWSPATVEEKEASTSSSSTNPGGTSSHLTPVLGTTINELPEPGDPVPRPPP
ncbi:pH-response regulator protein palH/rim21 [Trapelia coarctata]|nr:pH-response regulator protein palH/rim21 [Trapelia coarctata]